MQPIVIKDFEKGIAPSPHEGFGDMRNLEISKTPGVARINYATVQSTATADWVKWFALDTRNASIVYALGDSANVYKSTDSGATWSTVTGNNQSALGQGLLFWKAHLLVAGGNGLEALDPATGIWHSFGSNIAADSDWHPMIHGQDDIVYGGAGRYVFTIDENPGLTFQAGTAATYTMGTAALVLPQDYTIKCLEELGTNIYCGTYKGSVSNYSAPAAGYADIFPWDRFSQDPGIPIHIGEDGVHQMKNINDVIYVAAGVKGNFYKTNGVSAEPAFSIPESIMPLAPRDFTILMPGAMTSYQGKLFTGIGNSTFTAAGLAGGCGVWSFKDGHLTLENIVSNGQDGNGTAYLRIGAIQIVNSNTYLISWNYGGVSWGIDRISTTRYTNYQAYFESQFVQIGSKSQPIPLSEVEFKLAKPMTTGQGVRIKYRTDLNADFTTHNTYDFATYGAISGYTDSFGVTTDGGIQMRAELTTSGTTTVDFVELILR